MNKKILMVILIVLQLTIGTHFNDVWKRFNETNESKLPVKIFGKNKQL